MNHQCLYGTSYAGPRVHFFLVNMYILEFNIQFVVVKFLAKDRESVEKHIIELSTRDKLKAENLVKSHTFVVFHLEH